MHVCPESFQQRPKDRLQEFLQTCLLLFSIHLLRTVLFTHYARAEAARRRSAQDYNFSFTALLSESAVFSSMHCVQSVCYRTDSSGPRLGLLAHTHTCERLTFNLNINLPTENFHSYWYSPLSLVLIENLFLWRNNDIQDFLNMCALWLYRFIKANMHWRQRFTVLVLLHFVITYLLRLTQDLFGLSLEGPKKKEKR